MVIQSRLNVQTFSFNEVPRRSPQNYLPPPYLPMQDDSINISNTSGKWFFSSTIHCNESNPFPMKNCTFSLPSEVPRRQEESTSNIQMIFSSQPHFLKWFSLKVDMTGEDWFIGLHLMMVEDGRLWFVFELELCKGALLWSDCGTTDGDQC
jgi:hypothetical protein